MAKHKWSELSDRQKTGVLVAISVQISLLLTALTDIYRRPREEIRGKKWAWVAVSFVNFAGPISYFLFGRRR
ncbi:MAG TPA: PLD nuclease N-terminal domain-containing protein [Rubrobacteraceae bacterium]|nr:PLD nuclease N-terminal domain-containing protein [Rubrobacteraceae bacterium]